MVVNICSALEFICAQAPLNILYGLGTLIHETISMSFIDSNELVVWEKAPLTCGMWYFFIEGESDIVLIGFIVMVMIVKTYKRRTRFTSTISHSVWIDYNPVD